MHPVHESNEIFIILHIKSGFRGRMQHGYNMDRVSQSVMARRGHVLLTYKALQCNLHVFLREIFIYTFSRTHKVKIMKKVCQILENVNLDMKSNVKLDFYVELCVGLRLIREKKQTNIAWVCKWTYYGYIEIMYKYNKN